MRIQIFYYKKNPLFSFHNIMQRLQGDVLLAMGNKNEAHKLWAEAAIGLLEKRMDRAVALAQQHGFNNSLVEVPSIRIRGLLACSPSQITSAAEAHVANKLKTLTASCAEKGIKECSPFFSRLYADILPINKQQPFTKSHGVWIRRTFPAPNVSIRGFVP